MIEERWFVGQTRPTLGAWAEKNLIAQSYGAYSPRIIGQDGKTGENLFPRYLLVRCEPTVANFRRINSTRGMQKLLPLNCEEPLPLPRSYVDELRARVGSMGTLEVAEEITHNYAKDQDIHVVSGPHVGNLAEFQYRKRGLAMILMEMMGRKITVGVRMEQIRPVPQKMIALAPALC